MQGGESGAGASVVQAVPALLLAMQRPVSLFSESRAQLPLANVWPTRRGADFEGASVELAQALSRSSTAMEAVKPGDLMTQGFIT